MTARLELLDPYDARAESIWRELERVAKPTYFLTWGWIENWLATVSRDEAGQLAVIRDDEAIHGAFLLGRRRLIRHHLLPSQAMFLNSTGVPNLDELCVEHNAVLALPNAAPSLAALVALLPPDWDELFLPAVDQGLFASLAVQPGSTARVDREVSAPFVDLARVRAAGDYLSLLSANTRAQIRKARRRVGNCQLEVAGTTAEALAFYDELVALHGASWRARGERGAFSDPWFERFHRRLITRRFEHGEIQMLRLRAGTTTVGCLYNLVSNGRVLFYQSGLTPFDDCVIKPGFLCHAAAIEHAASAGLLVYDLLGGDARYKASLSTDATRLVWLRVQRDRVRFVIEDRVRSWKQALAKILAPG